MIGIVNASHCPPRPIGGLEAQRLGERVAKRNGGLSVPQSRGLVKPSFGLLLAPARSALPFSKPSSWIKLEGSLEVRSHKFTGRLEKGLRIVDFGPPETIQALSSSKALRMEGQSGQVQQQSENGLHKSPALRYWQSSISLRNSISRPRGPQVFQLASAGCA